MSDEIKVFWTRPNGERVELGTLVDGALRPTDGATFPRPLEELAPASVAMQFNGSVVRMSSALRSFLVGIGKSRRSRENTRTRRDLGRAKRRAGGEP